MGSAHTGIGERVVQISPGKVARSPNVNSLVFRAAEKSKDHPCPDEKVSPYGL